LNKKHNYDYLKYTFINYKFYVNDEFYKESQIINNRDVIIISTSETIEDLGHSVYYDRDEVGLLGGEQMVLKSKRNKINPKYLFYSSKVFLKEIRKNATGVKVFRFNINDLKNTYIPVPSIIEQELIVKQIESKSLTTEKVILDTLTSIQKLKDYRQSLISEAVTGKIDVTDWEEPEK
jgi:type I restriction enzyme S subunit